MHPFSFDRFRGGFSYFDFGVALIERGYGIGYGLVRVLGSE